MIFMGFNELEARIAVLNEASRNYGIMTFSAKAVCTADAANDVGWTDATSDQVSEGFVEVGNNEGLVVDRSFEESARLSSP